jgi:hypothetical protein
MAEQTMQPALASASATWGWFNVLSATRLYDLVTRLVFISAILFLALPSAAGVATRAGGTREPGTSRCSPISWHAQAYSCSSYSRRCSS